MHTFRLTPGKVKWILNGCPSLTFPDDQDLIDVYVAESAANVFVQQIFLRIGESGTIQLDVVDDVSIRDVDVQIAVVVEIEHLRPEAQRKKARTQPRLLGNVVKGPIAPVLVQRI